jgi:hypothetical protein
MLALHTGIMPLDFSRISASWPCRLKKYCQNKGFAFLASGLSTEFITESPIKFKRGVVIYRRKTDPRACITFDWDGSEDSNNAAIDAPSLVRDVFDARTDYNSGEQHIVCLQALMRANMKNVIHGRPMLVTAADIENLENNAHGTMTDRPWPVFDKAIARIKETGITKKPYIQLIYGERLYKDALTHCINENWAALDALTKERIVELQPLMESGFATSKNLRWSLCNIGDPQYGAFNPMPLKSRDFYGIHHNGSYSTPTGQQKIAFIWAMRKRNESMPFLLKLPKDLMILIAHHLDHIVVAEIINRAMGWSLC